MKRLGIYIHIPFCVKKCHYCDFISYTNCQKHISAYVQSIIKEIRQESEKYKEYQIDTIFIGGGTPSFIDAQYIADIMHVLRESFVVMKDCEISIESNPNSLTLEKLQTYFNIGINRLSIGLQAKQDRLLSLIGRSHNLQQYKDAVANAKKVGFRNMNTDIMLGLPTQTLQEVVDTTKLAMQYSSHISAYSLILEEGTVLHHQVQSGAIVLPDEDDVVDMYEKVADILTQNGYTRYEVSNFALQDKECRHNLHCWQYQDYVGFGVASHSKVGDCRFSRTTNLLEYIDKINHNQSTMIDCQMLSQSDQIEEMVMLGLRTNQGVDCDRLSNYFGYDIKSVKQKQIKKLISQGLLSMEGQYLKLTPNGYYLMNTVLVELL